MLSYQYLLHKPYGLIRKHGSKGCHVSPEVSIDKRWFFLPKKPIPDPWVGKTCTKQGSKWQTVTKEMVQRQPEGAIFLHYKEAAKVNNAIFDHTGDSCAYSARLSGRPGEQAGMAKSLKVMPGDTIRVEVFAKYIDQNSSAKFAPSPNQNAIAAAVSSPETGGTGEGMANTAAIPPFARLLAAPTPDHGDSRVGNTADKKIDGPSISDRR